MANDECSSKLLNHAKAQIATLVTAYGFTELADDTMPEDPTDSTWGPQMWQAWGRFCVWVEVRDRLTSKNKEEV